jgi:YesN/AraC family two-component response regulator
MNASDDPDPPGSGQSDLNGLCVLLVEDSWHVATAMQNLLRAWGADVTGTAATAVDAERLVSQRIPDAAIVDINLRGGELAYELIDRLQSQGVAVVVTSGYADFQLAESKVTAILQKPVSETKLIACLRPIAQKAAVERDHTR